MKTAFEPSNSPGFTQFLPRRRVPPKRLLTVLLGMLWVCLGLAQPIELATQIDLPSLYSGSADGDSVLPVISPDGRYVAFASTADNLYEISGTNRMTPFIPPNMNVYLQDRGTGITKLVSVNVFGSGGGNANSWPVAVSTNGQYVLFESWASDLASFDTNRSTDVFLRDMALGSVTLISVNTNGLPANGGSRSPSMSHDGRVIAFVSRATDLVPEDTNLIEDVFVRDVTSSTTLLATPGAQSTNPANPSGSPEAPELSADGRYVAFYSSATNLIPGVANPSEVYVRDLRDGTTLWASSGSRSAVFAATGTSNNVVAFNHSLSDDGRYLAYEASTNSGTYGLILRCELGTQTTEIVATNASVPDAPLGEVHNQEISPEGRFIAFVAAADQTQTNTTSIWRWDAATASSVLISGDTNSQILAGSSSDSPAMSADGRIVAFISNADLTGGQGVGAYHVYLRDTQSNTTTLIDAASGTGDRTDITPAASPQLSADGTIIAFESAAPELTENDRNRAYDVFVRGSAGSSLDLISATGPDLTSRTPNGSSSLSATSISSSARYFAFSSDADNLAVGDTNRCPDIYLRDMVTRSNILVSVSTNGINPGNGPSMDPSVTQDGRFVAFASFSNDLVEGDTNGAMDVFVRDLQSGTTTLASIAVDGISFGDRDSFSPILSSEGRLLLFVSRARNIAGVASSYAVEGNLILRDLATQTHYILTTQGLREASATPDCSRIAYIARSGTKIPLFVWDAAASANIYTNTGNVLGAALSPDGEKLAFWLGTTPSLYLVNLAGGAPILLGTGSQPPPAKSIRFSGDGRYLACVLPVAGANQVFLIDTETSAQTMVSRSYDRASGGNAGADSVEISRDGRFIAYRSLASDLVPADTNGVPDVFLYDTSTGTTTLLSVNQWGNSTAANRSLRPMFSADSRTLYFQSWATDLVTGDANHYSDIFAWSLYSSGTIPYFTISLTRSAAGVGNVVTWPIMPGKTYTVQFKDSLEDPAWHDAGQGVMVGSQGWFQDDGSRPQRFYRVVARST